MPDQPVNDAISETSQNSPALPLSLNNRLQRIEQAVSEIHEMLANRVPRKEWYSTSEAAAVLGRSEYTVREWCRLDRVNAHKRPCGRGCSQEWIISHDEIERIRNKGLLPPNL